jgi:hypothetical protein
MMYDELEMDHALICNWHEQAWQQLASPSAQQQAAGEQGEQ